MLVVYIVDYKLDTDKVRYIYIYIHMDRYISCSICIYMYHTIIT